MNYYDRSIFSMTGSFGLADTPLFAHFNVFAVWSLRLEKSNYIMLGGAPGELPWRLPGRVPFPGSLRSSSPLPGSLRSSFGELQLGGLVDGRGNGKSRERAYTLRIF